MEKRPGIYRIANLRNGKVYIGSSEHAPRRIYIHRWKLRRGTHDNIFLQRAWDQDGEAAFSFTVVEDVPDLSLILRREQAWIDQYRASSDEFGYNLCPVAGTRRGSRQPASVGVKLSSVHRGKPKSPEQRAKMSAAAKGRKKSDSHKQRLREAAIRQFEDPDARSKAAEYARMARPYWKGKHLSDQTKAKLRRARLERPSMRGPDGQFLKKLS